MKLKTGEIITTKEFFLRWGKGIKAITPLQQTKLNFIGIAMVIIGILIGLYATGLTRTWWLFVILLGSLFLTVVNLIGMIQKYSALKEVEVIIKGGSYEKNM